MLLPPLFQYGRRRQSAGYEATGRRPWSYDSTGAVVNPPAFRQHFRRQSAWLYPLFLLFTIKGGPRKSADISRIANI
jgi:hypothetical protein